MEILFYLGCVLALFAIVIRKSVLSEGFSHSHFEAGLEEDFDERFFLTGKRRHVPQEDLSYSDYWK
jgi:hypothetical protein